MGILDNNPSKSQISPAVLAANRLKYLTKQTYQQMVGAFNIGSQIFWTNLTGATPSEIAVELGNDAKEIFELHAKLGALLASIKSESIMSGNKNGTVTVNQPQ